MERTATTVIRNARGVPPARSLVHNRLSYAGLLLVALGGLHLASLLVVEIRTGRISPYVGSFSHLALPAVLIAGLVLTLAGVGLERRRRSGLLVTGRHLTASLPRPDFVLAAGRWPLLVLLSAVAVAGLSLSVSGYRSFEFVESTRFCGGVCHQPMRPEASAHEDSAHAAVACSACHVGPGAVGFARSKAQGLGELIAHLRDDYPRPILPATAGIPPARATCEACHAPQQQYGNQVVLRTHFASDEASTDRSVAVAVKVGGRNGRTGLSTGAHWHADPANEVRYITSPGDPETIAWVSSTGPGGRTIEYYSVERPISEATLARTEPQTMDCRDCHNRQGHGFPSADRAIDDAIAAGAIDRDLPYIRKVALDLVGRAYSTAGEAQQSIAEGIVAFYRAQHPSLLLDRPEAIRQSANAVEDLWARNVFPDMGVTWGTYPDNIGHRDSPGCYRCHDERHVSIEGRTISQECSLCHVPPVPAPMTADDLAGGAGPEARRSGVPAGPGGS